MPMASVYYAFIRARQSARNDIVPPVCARSVKQAALNRRNLNVTFALDLLDSQGTMRGT